MSTGSLQQCVYCGKQIGRGVKQCPYCREAQAEIRVAPQARASKADTRRHFRSGLLLMLMALLVHYFANGYSPMVLPNQIQSPVTTYLVPLLFLGGLTMSLRGFFLRVRA